MGLSSRSRVAALAERRCSPHQGIETEMPVPLHGVHEVGQRRLEPFTADAVGSLPDHDDRFAYSLVVDAPSHDLLALIVAGLTQQPDAVLAMVAGYRGEFVENPSLCPSWQIACWYRSRIVATSSCFAILLTPPPMWPPPEFSVTC